MTDKPNVYEGMAQVIAALSYIPKQRGDGVRYTFRGIDAVMNHLHAPLADAGLFLSPRVMDDWSVNAIPGKDDRTQYQAVFRVCVDVYASDGSTVTLGPGLAQSHDYGDKAVYQAQQNAIKYILLEAFAIPTEDQDMDARVADDSPRFNLKAWTDENTPDFVKWTPDEKREAWVRALIDGQPKTAEEAEAVVERMLIDYEERTADV